MKSKIGILVLGLILFVGMVNAQCSGEITDVDTHIINSAGDAEVEFTITIENTDTINTCKFKTEAYSSDGDKVLCVPLTKGDCVIPYVTKCQYVTINPGETKIQSFTSNYNPLCSLPDFNEKAIIKLFRKGDVNPIHEVPVDLGSNACKAKITVDTNIIHNFGTDDEVEFTVSIKNTGSNTCDFMTVAYSSDGKEILCTPLTGVGGCLPGTLCQDVTIKPGETKTQSFSSDYDPVCSLPDFKGKAIIRVFDSMDNMVAEKEIDLRAKGYITDVKVNVIDTPSWLDWIAGEDEMEFIVTIKNIDPTPHTFQIQIWDATNSSNILCLFGKPGPPGRLFCKKPACKKVTLNPGDEITEVLTTNWRLGCSIADFKGIPIIKLVDENDITVDEVIIPTYYENLTILHESDDELRNVSDPLNYTHQLILDEDCEVVGGDFCVPGGVLPSGERTCKPIILVGGYGEYAVGEYAVNPKIQFVSGTWTPVLNIKVPEIICYKENPSGDDTYGFVDGNISDDIAVKLPDGNTLHYILNKREYSSFNIRKCMEFDYTEKIVLHQAQYKELVKEFFGEEKFYKKLKKVYEDKFEGSLESLDYEETPEAQANQIYCFKTHLRDTDTCFTINNEWYSLTDTNPIGTPPYSSSYIKDIRRWNYDQEIDELV